MAKGKDVEDYADTAVLPSDAAAPELPDDTARVRSMTVQDLERLLTVSPTAELPQTDPEIDSHGLEHSGVDAAAASYAEYLQVLDQVPVLRDVVQEPRRVPVRDFRLGERPDVRREPREDAYALREQHACDLERAYTEYSSALDEPPKRRGARPAPHKNKMRSRPSKRAKRRKA